MDDSSSHDLSLIPYDSVSRDVVLRHGSAVVVYDKASRLLSLRNASDASTRTSRFESCPYCHRAFDHATSSSSTASPPATYAAVDSEDSLDFVNPGYFQKLQYQYSRSRSVPCSTPSTPRLRLNSFAGLSSTPGTPRPAATVEDDPEEASTVPPVHSNISSQAFSPGYLANFFTVHAELGRGGKGVVFLVRHKLAGHALGQYACKRVAVGDDHQWLEKVLTEVQLLQGLSHQNIVAYRHAWLEDHRPSAFTPSVPCLFILQQYCNAGDLHAHVLGIKQPEPDSEQLKERVRRRSKGQLDETAEVFLREALPLEEVISIVRDITSGLHYLHSNNLVHRDLKPKNCLLHRDKQRLRVLVSDFGETQAAGDVRTASGATGTLSYCAPEVLIHDPATGIPGQFTTKSDVFSLGMIVYFVCFGKVPYSCADEINDENEDAEQLKEEIRRWSGVDDHRERADLPEKLYKFLKLLLSRDASQRPSTEDILRAVNEPEIQASQHASNAESGRHTSPRRQWAGADDGPRCAGQGIQAAEARSSLPPRTESHLVLRKPRVVEPVDEEHATNTVHLPRLLPPPERTMLVQLKTVLQSSDRNTLTCLRLLVFAAKMWSLHTPCLPFLPDAWIAAVLVVLAGLDLMGVTRNVGQLLSFAAVHYLVIAIAGRLRIMCRREYR